MGGTAVVRPGWRAVPAVLTRALWWGGVTGVVLGALLVLSQGLLAGGPVPFWLENTAGVWVVTAFAAGLLVRRPVGGALAGAGGLALALVALDSVWFATGDEFALQFLPVFRPRWALISVAVGAALGGLGGWTAARPGRRWVGVGVVAGGLVGEAAALLFRPPHPAFDPRVAATQIALGVAAVVTVGGRARLGTVALAGAIALAALAAEVTTGVVSRLVWG